jgi:glucokinase
MKYLIGVDIGGTSVKLGLIGHGEQFSVVRQLTIPTQPQDAPMIFMQRIAEAVRELADKQPVDGIGVGCPGLIDPWQGLVRTSPNLKNLPGFEIKKHLSVFTGLPVELQNDANAAVLGEWLFSPVSKGVQNLVLLTLGTGVGGGVVCDSHLLVGGANAATELGHIKIEYNNGAPCGCGKHGCLEAFAGSAGIRRIANDLLKSGMKSSLKAGNDLTTREIAYAADKGDEAGQQALRKVGYYIGRAIATFLETFAPEKVVLGGGASAAIGHMMPGIQAGLDECSSFAFTRGMCKIERSAFPDDINVIGAAATYLNLHR